MSTTAAPPLSDAPSPPPPSSGAAASESQSQPTRAGKFTSYSVRRVVQFRAVDELGPYLRTELPDQVPEEYRDTLKEPGWQLIGHFRDSDGEDQIADLCVRESKRDALLLYFRLTGGPVKKDMIRDPGDTTLPGLFQNG